MDSSQTQPKSVYVPNIRTGGRRPKRDQLKFQRRQKNNDKNIVPNPLYDLMDSGINCISPYYNKELFRGHSVCQSFNHRRLWGANYNGLRGFLPYLFGSLSSRSRGGFNSSLFILDGAYLIIGTKNPEVAVFNTSSFDYNDSKPLLLDGNVTCLANGNQRKLFFAGDITGNVQLCCHYISSLGQMRPFVDTAITSISPSICDTKIVITGAQGAEAALWDVATLHRECKLQMKGYEPYISQYHPFWALIFTGSRSQHCSLYDPRTPVPILSWTAHRFSLTSGSWVPGHETYIMTHGRGSTAKIWDIRMLKSLSAISDDPKALVEFRTSPSERQLQLSLLSKENMAETVKQCFVTATAFNPRNSNIVTLGDSLGGIGHYYVPDIIKSSSLFGIREDIEPITRLEGAHEFAISNLNYADTGDLLVSCANDSSARVWHEGFSGYNGGNYATTERDLESVLYLSGLYESSDIHPSKYPIKFRWNNVSKCENG